jgi:hypothetical protein
MPTQTTSVVLATLQGGSLGVDASATTSVAAPNQAETTTEPAADAAKLAEKETAMNGDTSSAVAPSTSPADASVTAVSDQAVEGTAAPPPNASTTTTPDAEISAAPPKDNKALFRHLVKILEVTPEQAAALKDSRFVAQEMDEILKDTLSVLTELRSRLTQCGEDLETEFNNVRTILTPSQSAKFLVWVSQNKACMHMLNELWSKVYPSTQKDGGSDYDISLAPSGESSP